MTPFLLRLLIKRLVISLLPWLLDEFCLSQSIKTSVVWKQAYFVLYEKPYSNLLIAAEKLDLLLAYHFCSEVNREYYLHDSIAIFLDSLECPFHHFPLAHEIHFQEEFFEGNFPFIPPNIIISWIQSVSTNTCNW